MLEHVDVSQYVFVTSSTDTTWYLKGKANVIIDPEARPEVYIDSADEVDLDLNMIKGGGGALLREKALAHRSLYNVFIVDYLKLTRRIGSFSPVPIEVVPPALENVLIELRNMRLKSRIRLSKTRMGPTITDNNNYIVDIYTGPIDNPQELDAKLKNIPGVVETGLFYDIIDTLIIGYPNSAIRITRNRHRGSKSSNREENTKR